MAAPHAARPGRAHAPGRGGVHARPRNEYEIADLALAPQGAARIAWAADQMPVLAQVRQRLEQQQPLADVRVAACLHVTPETANLLRTLVAGGASAALCSAHPRPAQDDVAAVLENDHGSER